MSPNYYTNVACVGNNILYRGIKEGRRIKLKVAFEPTLFLPSKKPTAFKNLEGEYLDMKMLTISKCMVIHLISIHLLLMNSRE